VRNTRITFEILAMFDSILSVLRPWPFERTARHHDEQPSTFRPMIHRPCCSHWTAIEDHCCCCCCSAASVALAVPSIESHLRVGQWAHSPNDHRSAHQDAAVYSLGLRLEHTHRACLAGSSPAAVEVPESETCPWKRTDRAEQRLT
jgi:hypothetical protein